MTKALTCAAWFAGGVSTVAVRQMLRMASRDPGVNQIALVIDSPGGQVLGTSELANDVRRIDRDSKPVYGFIDDLGCSAAYWVGSQCRRLWATDQAWIGSIGTYSVLYDSSRAAAMAGVEVHVVRAGAMKGAGEEGTPITTSQLKEVQTQVDQINDGFLAAVSLGRKLTRAKVSDLATGQVYIGQQALDLGLVDRLSDFDSFLAFLSALPRATSSSSSSPTPSPRARTNPPANPTRSDSPMNWKDRLLAFINGMPEENAETTDPRALAPTLTLSAPAPVTEPTVTAEIRQALAQIPTLQATIQAQQTTIDELRLGRETDKQEAFQEKATRRVDQAIASMRSMPAARERLVALASKDQTAFSAVMDEIEAMEPIEKVQGRLVDASDLIDSAEGATKEFMAKVAAYQAEQKCDATHAMKTVATLNPALAARMRDEQDHPSEGGQ